MPCKCNGTPKVTPPTSYEEAAAMLAEAGLPNPYESPEAKAKYQARKGTRGLCKCKRALAKAALAYLPGEGPPAPAGEE